MNIGTILLAVLVFGVLIFVHELGHFLTAKWSGIKVNEFAMGMGPLIWSFTRGETRYALRLFPIGGFVAMEGENDESDDKRAFCNVSVWKRMIVSIAGSAMNLALGLLLLIILSSQLSLFGTTEIAAFTDDAASSEYLMTGDVILNVNGSTVRTDNDLIYEFMRDRDGAMDLIVNRGGEKLPLNVQFRMDTAEDGTEFIYLDFKVRGVKPDFAGTIMYSLNWTSSIIKQVWGSLIDLLTGRFGFTQLSGPVGVTEAIGKATSAGYRPLLMMISYITVNLGVFNLLPIPALDGGRMLFLLIELIRRKPVNPKYEGIITTAGFALLIGLMICVTLNDVFKIFTK